MVGYFVIAGSTGDEGEGLRGSDIVKGVVEDFSSGEICDRKCNFPQIL